MINSKNTIPVLDCILFELEGNTLRLTASDPDNTLSTSVEVVDCSEDFSFAISSKILIDSLKEISEQPLRFEVKKDTYEMTIYYLNGKYSMVGQNADEYPSAAVLGEGAVAINIPTKVLSSGITCSLFATADDELRPVMNGIYFDINSEGATFVASDGHKLVCSRNSISQLSDRSSFILPKKPASLLKAILAKESDNVSIEFDSRVARFSLPEFRMVCRLIDGRYPNYNSVIPQNNPHLLTIDRITLVNALRRVAIFSPASSGLVKLRIQQNQLSIFSQDKDFSVSAKESMTCQYEGVPMSIGFKSSFLIDILNSIPSQEITIKLADPARAGVFVPTVQEENENLLMLLMPMVLND